MGAGDTVNEIVQVLDQQHDAESPYYSSNDKTVVMDHLYTPNDKVIERSQS